VGSAQGVGGGPAGACVDDAAPTQYADTATVNPSQAGSVFDSTAQNAQRPAWNQLSPLHL